MVTVESIHAMIYIRYFRDVLFTFERFDFINLFIPCPVETLTSTDY